MNKTVTVNIGGIVFHIDENAYERFKHYLESIRSHFTTAEGRDEIMQDIESRIAEMFQDRVKDSKQVITLEDVDEVTVQMGRPEQFGDEAETEKEKSGTSSERFVPSDGTVKRRLYRNPDDKLLGGVCSGIASYFDIDTVWIRLAFAFIFFVFGSGFLLYILLWIIIPEAKTTAEKLQMRGEPVTISNIEKNVKEEMEQVKGRVSDLAKDGKKAGTVVGRIFEAIGEVIRFFFILLGKLIAVFFLFIGLIVAFAAFISLFALIGLPGTHYPAIWNQVFISETHFTMGFIGAVILIGIPFLMLAYAGARMLFNIKKSSRIVGFTALGIWLIGLAICLFVGVRVAREFSEKESVRREIPLMQPSGNVMYIEMENVKNEEKEYDEETKDNWDDDFYLNLNSHEFMSKNIKLDIVKSQTDSFELVEILYARGSSRKAAIENATHISYTFTQMDSLLRLNHHFKLATTEKFRAQKVQLVLKVPVGAKIHLDESLRHFIYDVDNVQNVLDYDMIGRTWIMTSKGLDCTNCDGTESTIDGGNFNIKTEDGDQVTIDENGVRINGSDGAKVTIDSMGVVIKKNGENVVKIGGNGVKISTDEKGKKQMHRLVY